MNMKASKPSTKRCALYTRKSSEEGLEQDFNSLDAQREACAAYVVSQKAEGWQALPHVYDDGGYSGGNTERPALQRLLADIRVGEIDVIVVYKIDRLTRSLADFARMVELFEHHQVSFVSVTQAFNTTTSMGRLTLNVLLSFAQFEREVTGERIRDKIAASKAKGMWMGGTLPLGYDLPTPGSRTLAPNADEADTVQTIFASYLKLGSVHPLQRELRELNIRSKRHVSAKGTVRGGGCFSRGALFHLLRNRLYLGEINHRDKSHPGLHQAIITHDLFDAVQAKLDAHVRRPKRSEGCRTHAPLTGRIFDGDGQPMSPTFCSGRGGKLYRYYVSASLHQGSKRHPEDRLPRRVSASVIEAHLAARLTALVPQAPAQPLDLVLRLEIHATDIFVFLSAKLKRVIEPRLKSNDVTASDSNDPTRFCLMLPFQVTTSRGRTELIAGASSGSGPNPALIGALRAAHALTNNGGAGTPSISVAPASSYQRRLMCLAFLAPDIQDAILAGNQPTQLILADLMDHELPVLWSEQRKKLGCSAKT